MRKCVFLIGMMLLVSMSAAAQDNSKFDVFGGYSYLMFRPDWSALPGAPSTINFNGGVGSISYNLNSWIGGVGEFGGYHAGTITSNGVAVSGASIGALSYLFGPKLFVRTRRFTPFAQALFGGIHASPSGLQSAEASQNSLAMAFGGGLDWNATHHIAVRIGQVEYLMTRFSTSTYGTIGYYGTGIQNNIRYSAGVVLRF